MHDQLPAMFDEVIKMMEGKEFHYHLVEYAKPPCVYTHLGPFDLHTTRTFKLSLTYSHIPGSGYHCIYYTAHI